MRWWLVGLAVRLWIMTGRLGAIDSDEAITGLMARHLLDGELRAFMWRLSYQGTIVTWPVAASFWLFGSSRFTLELPFLLMSAGAAVMIWRIGLRFLSPFQAAFAALAFWLWPAIYVWVSVKPLIFYVPTLVLGLAVVLSAVRVAEKPSRIADWCVLGLCAGAGWWTSPNIMYFALPVGRVVHRLPPARDLAGRALRRAVRRARRAAVDLEPGRRTGSPPST